MSWKDDVRKASFRGVPFHWESDETEAGRELVVHKYPGRDRSYVEDLNQKDGPIDLNAWVVGDDVARQRQALIDACNKPGAGRLVHPQYGEIDVICETCRVSHSSREGRMARFRLTFRRAEPNRYPAAVADTKTGVVASAAAARDITISDFTQDFDLSGTPGFVAESAETGILDLTDQMTGLGDANPTTTFSQLVDDIANGVSTLVQAPLNLATKLDQLATTALDSLPLSTLPQRLERITAIGIDVANIPATTTTRLVQRAALSRLGAFMRDSALIALAERAPDVEMETRSELIGFRTGLANALQMMISDASSDGRHDAFRATRALRSQVIKDLTARAPTLAEVIDMPVLTTQPSLLLAHRIYGDASRATELARRNRLRHPGFAPGGEVLEALVHGR